MFSKGSGRVIPIGSSDEAYRLKRENPHIILVGERNGKIMPEFDVGNSPTDFMKIDVCGKTIVHTTVQEHRELRTLHVQMLFWNAAWSIREQLSNYRH